MAWSNLKAAIAQIIKTNGNQEITGQLLQNVLNNIVSSVGENFSFAGIATPSTSPGTPDGNVFYLAFKNGEYPNFSGIALKNAGLYIIYNTVSGTWTTSRIVFNSICKTLNNSIYYEVIGSTITPRIYKSGTSVNSSNLISIPNTDFTCYNVAKQTDSGAYANVPAVIIFDKNFKFIKAIFNKESNTTEIRKSELPSDAAFFIMQSKDLNAIPYTDFGETNNEKIYDTGISFFHILSTNSEISASVSGVADSVSAIADNVSIEADAVNTELLVSGGMASNSGYYISSRIFGLGGKLKAINFADLQYSEFSGKKVKIVVGQAVNDAANIAIKNIIEISVSGKAIDLSELNIEIPTNGLVGLVNDNGIFPKYSNNASKGYKSYLANSSIAVGKIYSASASKGLYFPFNIEVKAKEPLTGEIEKLATTLDNFVKISSTTAVTYNLPKITTSGSQAVSPLSWIASKVFIFGGTVKKAYFYSGSEELQGQTAYIVVAEKISDDKATIISRTAFSVSGTEIDLSSLNIQIPENGLVGINLDGGSANYGYNTSRPSDFTDDVFVAQGANAVGNTVTRHSSFKYLNFPFNVEVEAAELITQELDRRITALENKKDIDRDFSDKVCVIMGDSITWYGHDDLSGTEGWTHYFKDWFNFKSIKSYARSGATWSCTANTEYDIEQNTGSTTDNNVGYNQMNRLLDAISKGTQETPDYIIVALGTNDAWHRYSASSNGGTDAVAELFNNTTDYEQDIEINTCLTTAKAIRYFSDMVTNNLPDTQVILLTPLQSSSISYNNVITIGDIIEECAKYCSYPVIRQDKECGVYRIQEARGYVNTKDGTHLSATGAKKVGNFLAQRIKTILR